MLLEINNECDFFKLDGLSPETVHESIEYAKSITYHGRRLLVSTSYAGKLFRVTKSLLYPILSCFMEMGYGNLKE